MKLLGEYCKELCDGNFNIKLDLIEIEMLDELLSISSNAIESGAVSCDFDSDILLAFVTDFQNKKDSLVCEEIDKKYLVSKMMNELSESVIN